jgi:Ni/Fe-hydrogenase subunit HybB-like protein
MPYLIVVYLLARVGDMLGRGVVLEAMRGFWPAVWWWLEIALLLTALALFATAEFRRRPGGLAAAAWATVLGLVVHRTGVAVVGLDVPEYPRYVPHVAEVLITVGIVSLGLLTFRVLVAVLPVYKSQAAPSMTGPSPEREPALAAVSSA